MNKYNQQLNARDESRKKVGSFQAFWLFSFFFFDWRIIYDFENVLQIDYQNKKKVYLTGSNNSSFPSLFHEAEVRVASTF